MFKLDENEERIIKDWPVVISMPADGGKSQKNEVTADFLLLGQDEYNDLVEATKDNPIPDAGVLRRVVVKLCQFADADGKALEHSPELLERVCKVAYIRTALLSAYWDVMAGRKAQRKN